MISENIRRIKEKIKSLAKNPDKITLVAVSKGVPTNQIIEAINLGITDIGENRIQEAAVKYNQLRTPNSKVQTLKWHLVGHLQTNKVKEAVKIFDLIHSVDSTHLAKELDKQAAKINKVQDILIQVNTSGETTKFGIRPEEALDLLKAVSGLKNIHITGLMTIAPFVDSPEDVRPYFRKLRELRDRVNELRVTSYELRILSMGMTDDFEVALQEGSNMLRIGRAIFA